MEYQEIPGAFTRLFLGTAQYSMSIEVTSTRLRPAIVAYTSDKVTVRCADGVWGGLFSYLGEISIR